MPHRLAQSCQLRSIAPKRAALKTWIFTIGRNLRIDAARRARRGDPVEDPSDTPDAEPAPDDGAGRLTIRGSHPRGSGARCRRSRRQVVQGLSFFSDKAHSGNSADELKLSALKHREIAHAPGDGPPARSAGRPGMTPPNHHPSEDLIPDRARGALESGRALGGLAGFTWERLPRLPRISIRLGRSRRRGADRRDRVPAELAPDALAKALAGSTSQIRPPTPPPRRRDDWIRRAARRAGRRAARHRRRCWHATGVWVANVTGNPKAGGPRSYLLGVAAGMAVPRHTHKGTELVCVLKGAFEDRGVIYGPGDSAESDETVEHRPHVYPATWRMRLLWPPPTAPWCYARVDRLGCSSPS